MAFSSNPADLQSLLQALARSSGAQDPNPNLGQQIYPNPYQQPELSYNTYVPQVPQPPQPQIQYDQAYQHTYGQSQYQQFSTDQHQQSSNEGYDPRQPLMLQRNGLEPRNAAFPERRSESRADTFAISRGSANHTPTPAPPAPPAPPKASTPRPSVDPSTIIDWKAGLRHVTELAARNAQLGEEVKRVRVLSLPWADCLHFGGFGGR